MRLIDKEALCGLLADNALEAQLEDECTELAIKELLSIVRRMPEAVVRCRECKYLNVVNRKELYAHCPKTNTVFLPFELDTREHFCSLGERKEGADND